MNYPWQTPLAAPHLYEKEISNCGMVGFINRKGKRIGGAVILNAITSMNERGNGLGAGFAAYGIYSDLADCYAFHVMYHDQAGKDMTEEYILHNFHLVKKEKIPIRPEERIKNAPLLKRYFLKPKEEKLYCDDTPCPTEADFIVKAVMTINSDMTGAYVFSSGKNMGAFKGVGFADEIGRFYRIEDYEGYIWTAHNRFPTNTPGWWGGAHPFTLLDWSIVHNGEISSYGINKRYLEMHGYKCTLFTDTEVITYLFDLLVRKHGLAVDIACRVLAPAFWQDIDRREPEEKEALEALRMVYGPAVLNGPFAVLFGSTNSLIGFNDRIKLRPLVCGEQGDFVYMASEEAAIREIDPHIEKIWAPKAGEPVIAYLEEPALKKG
jgi:glutamate synthase domain-containing protein 1